MVPGASAAEGDAAEADVLRADPRHRVAFAIVAVLGLAIGALGIVLFRRRLVSLYVVAIEDPAAAVDSFMTLASWIFVGFGVVVTVAGVHLFIVARRSYRSAQIPPPGAWVLRDTPVVRGEVARRRAKVAMVLSATIAVLGAATPFVGSAVLENIAPSEDELQLPAD